MGPSPVLTPTPPKLGRLITLQHMFGRSLESGSLFLFWRVDLEISHQRKRKCVPICGNGCELIVMTILKYIHILTHLHCTPEANVMLCQFYVIKKKKKECPNICRNFRSPWKALPGLRVSALTLSAQINALVLGPWDARGNKRADVTSESSEECLFKELLIFSVSVITLTQKLLEGTC